MPAPLSLVLLLGAALAGQPTPPGPTTCAVHRVALRRASVPIQYGLPGPGYFKVRQDSFPNSNRVALGGCEVRPEKTEVVGYCPRCRAAEARWAARRAARPTSARQQGGR